MKVVLTSGDSIKVSLEAFRLYKKRSGLDLYAYDLDTGESHDYRALLARIDDDEVFGYEPDYVICNKDLGQGHIKMRNWDTKQLATLYLALLKFQTKLSGTLIVGLIL